MKVRGRDRTGEAVSESGDVFSELRRMGFGDEVRTRSGRVDSLSTAVVGSSSSSKNSKTPSSLLSTELVSSESHISSSESESVACGSDCMSGVYEYNSHSSSLMISSSSL